MKNCDCKGWCGANEANWMFKVKQMCDICGIRLGERVFHKIDDVEDIAGDDHIVICRECRNGVPEGWHGCGCGG